MNCAECEKIKNKKHLIYEDNLVVAMLKDKPVASGHIVILSKEHHAIIEKIPDNIFEQMFNVTNKISMLCFDTLGAHGTNILIKNGVAAGQSSGHAKINIIPRFENDGFDFQWNPLKQTEEDLSTAQLILKDALEKPVEQPKEVKKEEIKEEVKLEDESDEDNYLTKQLERIP